MMPRGFPLRREAPHSRPFLPEPSCHAVRGLSHELSRQHLHCHRPECPFQWASSWLQSLEYPRSQSEHDCEGWLLQLQGPQPPTSANMGVRSPFTPVSAYARSPFNSFPAAFMANWPRITACDGSKHWQLGSTPSASPHRRHISLHHLSPA